MKQKLLSILIPLSLLLLFLRYVYNSAQLTSKQIHVDQVVRQPIFDNFDFAAANERLGKSLRIKTVSYKAGEVAFPDNFVQLHEHIERSFPLVHQNLKREIIGNYSLLYTWEPPVKKDKLPFLLMSHLDVVPAVDDTLNVWDFEPFAGIMTDAHIYGRGAIDVKAAVLAILEAAEVLLGSGFVPPTTIYFLFGHDEEVGGHFGSKKVAELLQERNVTLDFVLDEGGSIVQGVIPIVPPDVPVALISNAEKGYLTLDLSVSGEGGHSSMPPLETPIGILARAITKLETNPFPPQIGAVSEFLDYLAPEMSFINRLVIANRNYLGFILLNLLGASKAGNAAIRTTIAPTVISGSPKDNVLPTRATCLVNFRIAPGDTTESVEAHVKKVIADDRVKISRIPGAFISNPSPLSPVKTKQFDLIHKTIKQMVPAAVVTPTVILGATDARWFYNISKHVYRHIPYTMLPTDLSRFHGINERISKSDYERCIRFYYQLILNAQQL